MERAITATMRLTNDPAKGANKPGMVITLTGDTDARTTELVTLGFRRNPYNKPEWTRYLDLTGGDANAIIKPVLLALRETLGITQIARENF